jgi:hypothetical protein
VHPELLQVQLPQLIEYMLVSNQVSAPCEHSVCLTKFDWRLVQMVLGFQPFCLTQLLRLIASAC